MTNKQRALCIGMLLLPPHAHAKKPPSATLPGLPPSALAEHVLAKATDPSRRETAALLLGQSAAASAQPLLERCLSEDKERWVRAACAAALGRLGDEAALKSLQRALHREKHPAARRAVANAIVQLGGKAGVLELMWQLKSGTNHHRAAAMHALAIRLGASAGMTEKAWWTILAQRGYRQIARRPRGSPAFLALASTRPDGVLFFAPKLPSHQQVCAQVISVPAAPGPVTAERLARHAPPHTIADGCLLLLHAQEQSGTASQPTRASAGGLAISGLRYLLKSAPKLVGIGIDAPHLDAASQGTAVRDELLQHGRWAIAGLAGKSLALLHPRHRVLVVRRIGRGKLRHDVVMLAVFE